MTTGGSIPLVSPHRYVNICILLLSLTECRRRPAFAGIVFGLRYNLRYAFASTQEFKGDDESARERRDPA